MRIKHPSFDIQQVVPDADAPAWIEAGWLSAEPEPQVEPQGEPQGEPEPQVETGAP